MNHHFSNFIQAIRGIALRDDPFARTRATLAAYADLHAVPASAVSYTPFDTFFAFLNARRTRYATAFVAVLVVAGGGTLGAAERALPGDALYAVKVNVNEKIAGTFADTPKEEASHATRLAGRRADEAVTLIKQGEFDADTAVYLEGEVAEQVEASNVAANKLEAGGDIAASLAARTKLADALSTRAAALAPDAEPEAAAGAMLLAEPAADTRMMKMEVMPFEAAAPAPPADPEAVFATQLRAQATQVAEARKQTAATLLPGIATTSLDLAAIATTSATTTPLAPATSAWPEQETRAFWMPE